MHKTIEKPVIKQQGITQYLGSFHESEWSSLLLSLSMKVIFTITVSSKRQTHTHSKSRMVTNNVGYFICRLYKEGISSALNTNASNVNF